MTVIIFDLWNTLARKHASFSCALRQAFSLELQDEDYKRFERSMMLREWNSLEEMAMSFLNEFNIEHSRRNIQRIVVAEKKVYEYARPIKGMLALVQQLNSSHKLALLSNATYYNADLLERWDFTDYFDTIVFSWDVGLLKPDPKIYLETCRRLTARPDQCLFIDDSAENCHAATLLGMDAIVFESLEQVTKELRKRKVLP